MLGDTGPSFITVKKWADEFKRGHASLEGDVRSGWLKIFTSPEIVNKVHTIVLEDHHLKVFEIAKTVGISDGRVYHILTKDLPMKKLSARWVPCLLTSDQKHMEM